MRWEIETDGIFPEEIEEQGPPPFIINSDGGTIWWSLENTPLPRGTSASLGPEWTCLGYLEGDGLQEPQTPQVSPHLKAVQDVVNRALAEDAQRILHPGFFKPVAQTGDFATYEFTFNMPLTNDDVRDLFFGIKDEVTMSGIDKALLGLDCSDLDYHRAWQHRTEEMLTAETARHYGAFRQRYAAGMDYIAGP